MGEDAMGLLVFAHADHIECMDNLVHIVAVDFIYVKTKGFKFLAQVTVRHNFVRRTIELQIVVIDENNQVIQFVFVRRIGSFPDFPFLGFAVTDDYEYTIVFIIPFACQCHADATSQALTERARRNIDARAFLHIRMALQDRSFFPQCMEYIKGEVSQCCQSRVLNGAYMAFRQDEPVPVFPFRILRVNIHFTKIAGSYKISDGK